MATLTQVLNEIQANIIANGNNEITADVLRPILELMSTFVIDTTGELANLNSVDKSNLVAAINELGGFATGEFLDSIFKIRHVLDPSKVISFNAEDVGSGQTRVIKMPDVDVDLGAILEDIAALGAAVVLKGDWDASVGTFPGSGTAQAGYAYIVSVGGTVDGIIFEVNDRAIAILDNASTTTFAGNWIKSDYTDAVLSVAGKTGAVVLVSADITNFEAAVAASAAVVFNTAKVSFPEAPNDGSQYARKDLGWEAVAGGVIVEDGSGIEQFTSENIRFEGFDFDVLTKKIIAVPLTTRFLYVDTVSGNDGTATPQDISKPYKTLAAAYAVLQNGWTIEFIDGNVTRDCGINLPALSFIMQSESGGTFDFSGISGSSLLAGDRIFNFPNARMLFGGADKYFGGTDSIKIYADIIEVTCAAVNVHTGFIRGGVDSFVQVNRLIMTQARLVGYAGDLNILVSYEPTLAPGLIGGFGTLYSCFIEKIILVNNFTLFNGTSPRGSFKINEVDGAYELTLFWYITTQTPTADLDGIILTNSPIISVVRTCSAKITVRGDIGSSSIRALYALNNPIGSIVFEDFSGKLDYCLYTYHSYEFINCRVTFQNSLITAPSVSSTNSPVGVILRGHNVFNSLSGAAQLISLVGVLTDIYDYGTTITNCISYGDNINVIHPNKKLYLSEKGDNSNAILDLNNPYGVLKNMDSANAAVTYTTQNPVLNGYSRVLINVASEPVITGATKISGSDFSASTDMYMTAWYNGVIVQFWFEKI
jgi:hypothetical protein